MIHFYFQAITPKRRWPAPDKLAGSGGRGWGVEGVGSTSISGYENPSPSHPNLKGTL